MLKLIPMILALTALQAVAESSETIVAYKTLSIYDGQQESAQVHLTRRMAHIQKIILANDALKRSSYVGQEMFGIHKLFNQAKYVEAAMALDETERRLRQYKLWIESDTTIHLSIEDVVPATN